MNWIKLWLSLIFTVLFNLCIGQNIIEKYIRENDSVRVNQDFYLPYFEQGYTFLTPADEDDNLRGILLSLEDRKVKIDLEKDLFHSLAIDNGFAVVHISTGKPVDLFFESSSYIEE